VRELDLHGYTVDEAIRLFVDFYNRHVKSGSEDSLHIIHGYGSSGEGGKIRTKLRTFLAAATDKLDWRPGEDVEANQGMTIVFPRKVLPAIESRLATAILAYCSIPRTESKIAGEFRKHAPKEVKETIRMLVRQGRIREIMKGGHATYTAVETAH
jgi:hypothetical protein